MSNMIPTHCIVLVYILHCCQVVGLKPRVLQIGLLLNLITDSKDTKCLSGGEFAVMFSSILVC